LTGPENNHIDVSIGNNFAYADFTVKNTGNTALSLEWTHGLAPDGWTVGFANPILYLEPREEKVVSFGMTPPAQANVSTNAFEILVSVNGTNTGRFTEDAVMLSVGVLESMYANLTVEDTEIRPLEEIPRDGSASQNFVLRNDGNTPFSGEVQAEILDREGMVREDWKVTITPTTVSDLAVGSTVLLTVTLEPLEDVSRSVGSLTINVSADGQQITSFAIDAGAKAAVGNQGLFSSLSPGATASVLGLIGICVAVVARRVKKSGELHDDGLELVAPDSHTNPDSMGARRDEVLDISSAVDDLTSGEVSDEEIAKALMQSMDLPSAPAAVPSGLPPGMPPAGLPPAGLPPKGLPPVRSQAPLPMPLPSLPVQPAQPAVTVAPSAQGPPLPPGGLPPGWTMEQWAHYGHQWLQRQG
jgi:hypothetical protein